MEKEQTVRLVVELPKELHHRFKVKATMDGTTMRSVLMKCAESYANKASEDATGREAGKG